MEVYEFRDVKPTPDPIHGYSDALRTNKTPIIIDNGSFQCRVGWATSSTPELIFKNVLAKPRKERGKKDGEIQVGNDITNIEAVRFQLKTQFDRNVVTHFEVQEYIFNYAFTHLGIDTEGSVNHPLVITEAFLNPNYSRSLMSELVFECYGVPGVCYAVDSLLSYRGETPKSKSATSLIVSIGYQATHVIPIINGKVDVAQARRIDLGGYHCSYFMHRLLQLKYPAHFAAVTLSRAEELLHEHCRMANEYIKEISLWNDIDYYEKYVKCFQLPYNAAGLTVEQQREKRRELAKRLMEMNARKREEKLAEDEEELNQLLAIQELEEEGDDEGFENALKEFELNSIEELHSKISIVQARIEKTRQKIVAMNTSEDPMTEDGKLKIGKQHHLKDEEEFKVWVEGLKKKREELIERRAQRKAKRQEMAKRRTPAAVERMRLISELAKNSKTDDDFGSRDEDWDVYKAINKGGDSESEGEAEKLMELEQMLRVHDPAWGAETSREAHQLHVGIELLRVPELFLQPSMLGISQAGITETIEYVLRPYEPSIASALAEDIFVTGGPSSIPGLKSRLVRELTEIRPFQSKVGVRLASQPVLGPWQSARTIPLSHFISRQDYQELGPDYLKEHPCSNFYTPTPAHVPETVDIM